MNDDNTIDNLLTFLDSNCESQSKEQQHLYKIIKGLYDQVNKKISNICKINSNIIIKPNEIKK
jgi:hypothetical protein